MSCNSFDEAYNKLRECTYDNMSVYKLLYYATEIGRHAKSKPEMLEYEFYRQTAKNNNRSLFYMLPDVFGDKIDSFGKCLIDYIVECTNGIHTEMPIESAKYNATIMAALTLDASDAEMYYHLLARLKFKNSGQIIIQLYSRYLELTGIKWDLSNVSIHTD